MSMATPSGQTTNPDFTKNPWVKRAAKILVVGAVVLVNVANVWADGPQWLYVVANVVGLIVAYYVPNAPEFKDPRANYLKAKGHL